jgi:hypothetical protein
MRNRLRQQVLLRQVGFPISAYDEHRWTSVQHPALEHVERGRICPLQIIDHENDWLVRRRESAHELSERGDQSISGLRDRDVAWRRAHPHHPRESGHERPEQWRVDAEGALEAPLQVIRAFLRGLQRRPDKPVERFEKRCAGRARLLRLTLADREQSTTFDGGMPKRFVKER